MRLRSALVMRIRAFHAHDIHSMYTVKLKLAA